MDVLVHIGLNKCGSTYIQACLDGRREELRRAGVHYPKEQGRTGHYGLSRSLGFGPDVADVIPSSVDDMMADARALKCDRLILSSEYLSLFCPAGVARLVTAIAGAGARIRVVMFSRDPIEWIKSQFNQYVRTVEGAPYLTDINAYIDQVMAAGALRIADRVLQWRNLVPEDGFRHYRQTPGTDILAVFEDFSGAGLPALERTPANASLSINVLHRIGVLRQRSPRPERDAEITGLIAGEILPPPAPEGYLDISPVNMLRLRREVIEPFERLSVDPLPPQSVRLAPTG